MKITMRYTHLTFLVIANILLGGCAGQGGAVLPLSIYDNNAHEISGQVRVKTESGRKFQFELEQFVAEDNFPLEGVANENGEKASRLRDGSVDLNSATTLAGPATVDSSHRVTQVFGQVDFSWVDTRHFQLGWAPHLSYLMLASDYAIPGKSFRIDLKEPGIGAQINAGILLYKQWSLNITSKLTSFSSDTSNFAQIVVVRFQPTPQFNIDLGFHKGTLDLNMDTGIIYEQRTTTDPRCYEDCIYTYNNKDNDKSDLEIESQGYRLGFGWNF